MSEISILRDRKPEIIEVKDDSKNQFYQSEIQRLNTLIKTKIEENETMRLRLREFETKFG